MHEQAKFLAALERITNVRYQIHQDDVSRAIRPYFINTLWYNRLVGFSVGAAVGLALGWWLG